MNKSLESNHNAINELANACSTGNLSRVRSLLDAGGDPSVVVEGCLPLIFYAAASGSLGVIAELANRGADLNALDDRGETVLTFLAPLARSSQQQRVFKQLIDLGADPLLRSTADYSSPLDLALLYRNIPLAKQLVEIGAEPRHTNRDHPELLKLLKASGQQIL